MMNEDVTNKMDIVLVCYPVLGTAVYSFILIIIPIPNSQRGCEYSNRIKNLLE